MAGWVGIGDVARVAGWWDEEEGRRGGRGWIKIGCTIINRSSSSSSHLEAVEGHANERGRRAVTAQAGEVQTK